MQNTERRSKSAEIGGIFFCIRANADAHLALMPQQCSFACCNANVYDVQCSDVVRLGICWC